MSTTPDSYGLTGRASVPGPSGHGSSVPGQPDPGRISARASVPTAPAPPPGAGPVYGGRDRGRGRGGGRPPEGGPPAALVGKRRRPRWRKVLLATTLTLLLILALGTGGLFLYVRNLESNMQRVQVFTEITGERPAAHDGLNILMLGSDSRDPDGESGEVYRADTLMLLHVPKSERGAYIVSIPRDLWVYVPLSPDGSGGDREAKINAATAFGGVPLAVMTVENYTGVRIDHVMLVDFAGFVEVTDALGGVELDIAQTITSIHRPYRTFEEGTQQLSGEEALDYVRQRYQFADGDFTRVRNQQAFLKALMDKGASRDTMTNPGKLNAFLQTATSTLTVDEEFGLIGVGWALRSVRGDNLTFLTSPHAGTGNVGGESVVFSDDEGAAELYAAIRQDRMAQWVAANPDSVSD